MTRKQKTHILSAVGHASASAHWSSLARTIQEDPVFRDHNGANIMPAFLLECTYNANASAMKAMEELAIAMTPTFWQRVWRWLST